MQNKINKPTTATTTTTTLRNKWASLPYEASQCAAGGKCLLALDGLQMWWIRFSACFIAGGGCLDKPPLCRCCVLVVRIWCSALLLRGWWDAENLAAELLTSPLCGAVPTEMSDSGSLNRKDTWHTGWSSVWGCCASYVFIFRVAKQEWFH